MLSIAICDDSEIDREIIKGMLVTYFKGITKYRISMFENGQALLDSIQAEVKFDLVFLDIIMHEKNGVQIAQEIRDNNRKNDIIFVTSSPDFAIDSYDVVAFGYILKPVSAERFGKVMDRYMKKRHEKTESQDRYLCFKKSGKVENINYDDIKYIESRNTALIIHSKQDKEHILYGKLSDLENQIDDERFIRSHQSFLVNMNYIVAAKEAFVLDDGTEIPVRQKNKKQIRDQYLQYIKEKKSDIVVL